MEREDSIILEMENVKIYPVRRINHKRVLHWWSAVIGALLGVIATHIYQWVSTFLANL